MFTDMLAEVRKYGEGLIIVDQIPNKLTSSIKKYKYKNNTQDICWRW